MITKATITNSKSPRAAVCMLQRCNHTHLAFPAQDYDKNYPIGYTADEVWATSLAVIFARIVAAPVQMCLQTQQQRTWLIIYTSRTRYQCVR